VRNSGPDGFSQIVPTIPKGFLSRKSTSLRKQNRQEKVRATPELSRPKLQHGFAFTALFSALALNSSPAYPVGLGNLQVQSALRAPFRASIQLLGLDIETVTNSCVKARVASLDGELLAPLRIDIVRGRDNSAMVLTSSRNINEPLASVIVDMNCGVGIQREYQILLDPPSFQVNETVAPVAPVATIARSRPATVSETAEPVAADTLPAGAAKTNRPVSRNAPRAAPVIAPKQDSQNFASITKDLKGRERNVLRLSPPSSGDTARLDLILSTSLSDPATRPPVTPSVAPVAVDPVEATAQMRLAASQMEAMQAKMLAMELELARLRQPAAVVRPPVTPAASAPATPSTSLTETYTARWWLIGLALLLVMALGWLVWRIRRLKPSSPAFDWNDESGIDTIKKATQLAMARSAQKREAVARARTSMSSDEKANLQSALDKSYKAPGADGDATVFTSRINQKSALAEFLEPQSDEPAVSPLAPRGESPYQAPDQAASEPKAFEFTGNKEYVTSGAILQTPFDVDIGHRGRPLLNEAEEIVDARQQAEFWMSLQDPQRAVQALELYTYEHVQRPDSPLPWLLLFDLYRDLGYQEKYEDLYKRYRGRFNSKVPKWDEEPAEEQFGGLEDFPRLVQKACELWNTDEIVPFLESLLLDDRDGKREGFELPVYNDILFLAELAYELHKLPNLEMAPLELEVLPTKKSDPWAFAE
jgi:pilus assembly protein FimV